MASDDMVVVTSPWTVAETVERLTTEVAERDVELSAVFDHAEAARRHGLALRETRVVVFGNPLAGTPVMDAVPLAAIDLPLKVLVWAADDGTRLAYLRPAALAARH